MDQPPQDLFGEVPQPAPRRPAQRRAPAAQPRHTLFFALRPDPSDAAAIDRFAAGLLASLGVSGKRIAPERLHVTLDLVGHDADQASVDAARRAAATVRFAAIDVRFDAVMSFDAPSAPLVLLGAQGLDAVRGLRTTLGGALADQGFKPPRTYEPHMTLCYDPRHRIERKPLEPIGFRATGFALVRSHIGLSRHEVLGTWPLGN
ncbi:2'-5' RNA ligase family protein [uncultured Ramlibacter sp.]|uniref:2'-5' RNA ligase family protein n=1 Tax=uncultured Ramlibacter sp. TaxID=260755 RepID=UPI0026247BC4|nr:2'-5' RNA ligase family protein [uncultured Ramlibacter sp.]